MTKTGRKTIDEVVDIMNAIDLVWKNGFSHWRKKLSMAEMYWIFSL